MKQQMSSVKTFFSEVMAEARKTTWPHRDELMSSTVVVIASALLLSAFIWLSDQILVRLLKLLLPSG